MAKLGILIGRFQPLHLGHCFLINEALKHCERLLIIIGSSFCARNFKNPWTFAERKSMIENSFPDTPLEFAPVADYFYDEAAWIASVKNCVDALGTQDIILFGHTKDESSYYLAEFPEWQYQELANFRGFNATQIREEYFWNQQISENIPLACRHFLNEFKNTTKFVRLREEACFVRDYQKSWAQSPYPPIFVTTDAVVTCNAHILLIKRKFCPGQGLYALPGGFLEAAEWIKTGLMRELIEETGIQINETTLVQSLKRIEIFDYPERSLIGRVITHAGHFDLPGPLLPEIHAADDALAVEWLPLSAILSIREQCHDDHYQIITILLGTRL